MKKVVFDTYEELSKYAANMVASELNSKPHYILGLPTGGTPVGMYKEIAELYNKGVIDFSDVTTFNLDEYLGLEQSHDQSYYYFMNKNLYSKVNLKPENINIPSGCEEDIEAEAAAYDEKILEKGGIDMMILGIGPNGHIGFNEPADVLESATHTVDLTKETIEANARFFDSIDDVPKKAITMGVGNILKAKKILMLISGENKKEITKKLFSGEVSTQNPASLLQLHPSVTVLVDKAAND